ncbi:MAG: CDP-diacylglycerol--glycerol-3-phosphate 3-phosphatidyltransferase [Planctomycetota bacterium]|jgi:CDP-diacylglycerol--glycerol-3-phosphate 3-phosphatidyltransferase
MNLPNQITVTRLFLSGILFVFLEHFCRGTTGWVWYIAFALYIITVLSDGLDGYIARSRGQITAFGRIADPLADKIVIGGVLVMALSIDETNALVPPWIVVLFLSREFLVSGLRGYLEGHGKKFGAQWEGKTKLVVQAFYCGAILFYPGDHYEWVRITAVVFLYLTAMITVYTAITYVLRTRDVILESGD